MPTTLTKTNLIGCLLLLISVLSLPGQNTTITSTVPPTSVPQIAPTGADTSDPVVNLSQSTGTSMETVAKQLPDLITKGKGDGKENQVESLDEQLKSMDALMTTALDNSLIKQHLLNYLDSAEVSPAELEVYQKNELKAREVLADGDIYQGLTLLYALGRQQRIDGQISIELAHRIESTLGLRIQNQQLDKENLKLADDIETAKWNSDMEAKDLQHDNGTDNGIAGLGGGASGKTGQTTGQNGGKENDKTDSGANGVNNDSSVSNSNNKTYSLLNTGADSTTGQNSDLGSGLDSLTNSEPNLLKGGGSMELTEELYRYGQAHVQQKINEFHKKTNDVMGKADLMAYISALVASHRYTHAILAANFYRALYPTEEYPVALADQVNLSLELNNLAEQATTALRYNLDQNRYASASMALQTAFIANEYYPGFLCLPLAKKAVIRQFLDKIVFLKSAIKARDFDRVKMLTDGLSSLASDFDPTEPLQLVTAIKMQSDFHFGKAKLLAQKKDDDGALKEFQEAGALWPGNPDLQKFSAGFLTSEDTQVQAVAEFDHLIGEKNYRAIFERQVYFATGISGDKSREDQMKTALETVQEAEAAYQKAEQLRMHSDYCGAWETLRKVLDDNVDDPKVNKLFLEVSSEASEFVQALSQAKKAEQDATPGYCLALYLKAQSIYPLSDLATDGVKRLTQRVLDGDKA